MSLDQIYILDHTLNPNNEWQRRQLEEKYRDFEALRVLRTVDGKVAFCGDDFDKIYCKYYARQSRVTLRFAGLPVEVMTWLRVEQILAHRKHLRGLGVILDLAFALYAEFIGRFVSKILNKGNELVFDHPVYEELCMLNMRYREYKESKLLIVSTRFPWCNVGQCFFALDPSSADAYDAPVAFFGGANLRAASLDGEIVCAEEVLKIEPASALVAAVASRGTEEVKDAIAGHHAEALREAYLDGRRIEEALFHRDAYMRVGGQGGPSSDEGFTRLTLG
jgi:hypothetical protein